MIVDSAATSELYWYLRPDDEFSKEKLASNALGTSGFPPRVGEEIVLNRELGEGHWEDEVYLVVTRVRWSLKWSSVPSSSLYGASRWSVDVFVMGVP